MKTTIISENGQTALILIAESELEKFAIKDLSGGHASLITSGNNVLQNNVEGALMIRKPKE